MGLLTSFLAWKFCGIRSKEVMEVEDTGQEQSFFDGDYRQTKAFPQWDQQKPDLSPISLYWSRFWQTYLMRFLFMIFGCVRRLTCQFPSDWTLDIFFPMSGLAYARLKRVRYSRIEHKVCQNSSSCSPSNFSARKNFVQLMTVFYRSKIEAV